MSAKWSGREVIKKLLTWPWSTDPPAFEPGGLFFGSQLGNDVLVSGET